MSFYEINLLISPNLSQEEVSALLGALESSFQKNGKLAGERKAEIKKLAYPIEKDEEAWYAFFSLYPETGLNKKTIVDSIEKELKDNKNIIRYLVLNKDEIKYKASHRVRKPPVEGEKATDKEVKTGVSMPEEKHKPVELKDVEEKLNEMLGDE
ncbi:MAG: 30S ribosomal protein S6 [Candidatus Pacebacteria bacterium]|nr:30S ribosomal protein S6 [Candidatus Paceibacterota bacterium]